MKFCTAINCIDGRVQLPVIEYLKKRCGADYVDCVTGAGADLIMSERDPADPAKIEAILRYVQISVEKHGSQHIAIAGHHDCAGNPVAKEKHIEHITEAAHFLKTQFPGAEITGLWVDENWKVNEV
ncbi:MAG: carbonic anhydrase [Thermodesulfobacteriota bacterium]